LDFFNSYTPESQIFLNLHCRLYYSALFEA
jgi:hypothetical protein